jgi:hypothetical protein
LLDNDIDGKKAKIRYAEYFGDSIKNTKSGLGKLSSLFQSII